MALPTDGVEDQLEQIGPKLTIGTRNLFYCVQNVDSTFRIRRIINISLHKLSRKTHPINMHIIHKEPIKERTECIYCAI